MMKLKKNKYPGFLIVVEGTDGAGKTTLINKLQEYLSDTYGKDKVIVEKQPTDLSRKTRLFQKMMYSSAHAEINYRAVQLLTLSDRVQHNHEVIVPALKKGKIVICDRYLYTSIANMYARGYKNEKWFFDACKEIIKPDLSFLAYVDYHIAIDRILSRPEEKDRYLNQMLLEDVAYNFIKMRRKANFKIIDTSKEPEIAFCNMKEITDKSMRKKYEKK